MTTASDNADAIRDELAALGQQRKQRDADDKKLATDINKALRRAYGKVSVSEAARLLDMHRTTVYRVYHPHG